MNLSEQLQSIESLLQSGIHGTINIPFQGSENQMLAVFEAFPLLDPVQISKGSNIYKIFRPKMSLLNVFIILS